MRLRGYVPAHRVAWWVLAPWALGRSQSVNRYLTPSKALGTDGVVFPPCVPHAGPGPGLGQRPTVRGTCTQCCETSGRKDGGGGGAYSSGGLPETGPEMVLEAVAGGQGVQATRTRTPVLQPEAGPGPVYVPPAVLPPLCSVSPAARGSARVLSPQAPLKGRDPQSRRQFEALGLGLVASLGWSLLLQRLVSKMRAVPGADTGGRAGPAGSAGAGGPT